ncbi:hypothetical protein [Streptomyces sp. NBC_01334]|uniref:hypothetical protein n=1 Tax=Streptomyces sp. NBC_01334 TaxID=2903827 RepID=UPI002E14691A|nr:hypothetical protein OG736_10880 [Streptomyces sp. NBC_01334]
MDADAGGRRAAGRAALRPAAALAVTLTAVLADGRPAATAVLAGAAAGIRGEQVSEPARPALG